MRCHQSEILAMKEQRSFLKAIGIILILSARNLDGVHPMKMQGIKTRVVGVSLIKSILPRLLILSYCRIVIPKSYREEASSDLLMVFDKKPSNSLLKDLWEYTLGSFDFRITQIREVLIWIAFYIQKSIIKRRNEIELLNH
jgi:hypothetical protein